MKFTAEKEKMKFLTAGLAGVLSFLVFLPALRNVFVEWDDKQYVTSNPFIRSLDPAFFKWAFTEFYAGNWHPLTWISHALDYAIWGLNPLGHILTSLILHALATSVLALLIMKLLEMYRERAQRDGAAASLDDRGILIAGGITGILFGIHPLHVESVAWVAERKDVLSGLFFLLSVWAYLQYVQGLAVESTKGDRPASRILAGGYLLSLFFFIIALMSKPMAVSLPVVLLILDWYPLNRVTSVKSWWTAVVEKLPFVVCSLISSVVTIEAQKTAGAVVALSWTPLSTRLLVAAKALISYLLKMLIPLHLVPYYPYPDNAVSPFSPEYLLSVLLVAGITVASVLAAKRQKIWPAAWGYYVITLLPVLGIVQVGGQAMADRYTYLPSIGPFLIAGLAAAWVSRKTRTAVTRGVRTEGLLAAGAVAVFVLLSYTTDKQIGIWKDGVTLWTYVVEKEPERNFTAFFNRGIALFHQREFRKAIPDFDKALSLRAFSPESYFDKAGAHAELGDFDKAIENYGKATAQNPSYQEAYFFRGQLYDRKGRLDEAMEDFSKAIALNPSNYEAHILRGKILDKKGEPDKAMEDFSKAAVLNPSDYQAYFFRGQIYDKQGQLDKAMEDFTKVITLLPTNYVAYGNLGVIYGRAGRMNEAISVFDKAAALNPSYPATYKNRGYAYYLMGQYEKGLQDLDKAISLNKDYAGAYVDRAAVYRATGKTELALKDIGKACALGSKEACGQLKGSHQPATPKGK